MGLGRLLRQRRLLPGIAARTSGTTLRRCRTSSRISSAACARPSLARTRTSSATRPSVRRAHPPRGARLPRGRRRPARRHHEGPPRVAHQRRHRVAAQHLAGGQAEPRTTASRRGTRTIAGVLVEPHHNTYDIEFWGPDGMCTSFYLGALKAAVGDGRGRRRRCSRSTRRCWRRAAPFMETELWDGEYFIQQIEWEGLRAPSPTDAPVVPHAVLAEARALLEREGPKYQYGRGCLSDGVLGAWIAACCGVDEFLDPDEGRQPPAGRAPATTSSATSPTTPTRSGRPMPWATRRGCCSAPGPRAASSRCRSSTATRSGRASSTRWRRT